MDTATGLADAICNGFSRRLVIEPGDRDVRALLGQCDRNGGANSLLCARTSAILPANFMLTLPFHSCEALIA